MQKTYYWILRYISCKLSYFRSEAFIYLWHAAIVLKEQFDPPQRVERTRSNYPLGQCPGGGKLRVETSTYAWESS